ncbi:hypothetical protein LTR17_011963 [Elasticomyces elasticus]|nr:hypothetical protein LTR17_011963 [Elasticomyces elasticus]
MAASYTWPWRFRWKHQRPSSLPTTFITDENRQHNAKQEEVAANYIWDPLDTTKPSIRLLKVLPVTDQDKRVRVALHTTDLEASEAYDAVSYMWGSDSTLHEILIDDKIALVRQNIWRFLVHARDSSLYNQLNSSLWIDSICINQIDNDEKNHQVRQIRKIFDRAHRVIAWLGLASLDQTLSDCAGPLNRRLGPRFMQAQDPDTLHALSSYVRAVQCQPRRAGDNDVDDAKQAILYTLQRMCGSSYWSRLWIVQELTVARDAYCVSGDLLLSVGALNGFASLLDAKDGGSSKELAPFRNTMKIFVGNTLGTGSIGLRRSGTLAYVVEELSHHHCVDVRDHVYGVLGCVEGGDAFDVDYSASKEEVLLRALDFLHKNDDATDLGGRLEMLARVLRLGIQDVFQHPNLRREMTDRGYRIPVRLCSYFEKVPSSGAHPHHHDTTEAIHEIIDNVGAAYTFKRHVLYKTCVDCHLVRIES